MTAFPSLSRPPLREALLDIRLQNVLPVSFVASCETLNFDGFVKAVVMKQGAFKFEISRDSAAQASVTSNEPFGVRFERNNGAEVLQFRRDGMTLSILKNYTNWEAIEEAARNAWHRFLEASGPASVARLAVRYINVIELPPGQDYDEYLTAGPRIPARLPQVVTHFIQRVVVPFADSDATAIITQALETPSAGHISAVLDIDVFVVCSLEGVSAEIWSSLEKLRDIKNNIFFSSLTEKALDSFK